MRKDILMVILIPVLAFSFIPGCASINKTMQSWVGNHQSDLIANWGPPQQVMDDGRGGKIFIYFTTRSFTSPGHSTTTVTDQLTALATMRTVVPPATPLIPLRKHHHITPIVCFGLAAMVTFIAGHGVVSKMVIRSTQQRL
jgi:hypothetical protein